MIVPIRKTPLVNGETYHVFNRSVASIPIFSRKLYIKRFIFSIKYYQNIKPPIKLSVFNIQNIVLRQEILSSLKKKNECLVEIICYCIMPNHFHFVLKQLHDDGIKEFLRLISSSYSHYYNTKNIRTGPVFGGRFKAIRIENENQLQHVVRYIHLNPLTSHFVRDFNDLLKYKYSSLQEYLISNNYDTCNKNVILKDFNNSINKYREFLENQAEYQKSLHTIKKLVLE